MSSEFEASINDALLENDQPAILLKLSNGTVEANVWLTVNEAHALHRVSALSADSRALRLGKCANSQAHWGRDKEKLYLLIGHDDEAWDVGITLSESTFSTIINEIESYLRRNRVPPPQTL
jgi:hypothetical protein